MNLEFLFPLFGEGGTVTVLGLVVGLGFGVLSQRSAFCTRAAVVEFTRGISGGGNTAFGPKVAVWMLGFGAAIASTQLIIAIGLFDDGEARQITGQGSLSGAIIGGLMFGVGMVLARGCAARLLVLSATGNLRALMAGLILTIIAQASLRGGLSPLREWFTGLWTIGGSTRDMMVLFDLSRTSTLMIGAGLMMLAWVFAMHHKVGRWRMAGAVGVGLMVMLGWLLTYSVSSQAFSKVTVKSINLIGPSADTLMGLINQPTLPLVFDLGLIPGIFAGSMVAALFARDLKLQCFSIEESPMPRYVIGAVLMGFGGMLAGGCTIGAGLTGTSVFSLTAFTALFCMWVGGGITDYLVDRRQMLPAVRDHVANAPATTRSPAE